jgi:hypothetical protein
MTGKAASKRPVLILVGVEVVSTDEVSITCS